MPAVGDAVRSCLVHRICSRLPASYASTRRTSGNLLAIGFLALALEHRRSAGECRTLSLLRCAAGAYPAEKKRKTQTA
ncbi:hypothetical protein BDV98DRAFT_191981 [Pterulicium gracile]|uniref:Uncharacterized protein n=1 Tax=Pterulicium gracile TaxID=1884261 RepID=A0A5C3QAB9_9AGAR|nr:hypothetical protein BDV98DRAFT_191981 [Pterula gracilis]